MEGPMQSDFPPKIWNEIKEAVQSAVATAYPLDVAAEAKRIAKRHATWADKLVEKLEERMTAGRDDAG